MATGKPYRTEYDRTQNYKDYMKLLDLQIKNNKTNYDANILYKQTGVPTQPLDTRTFDEKQQDIAQLKVNLRSELRILLDDNVIQEVFNELNDGQIQFLAGIASSLIAELKPKYAVGMTSHHFIDVLDKKIRQEQDFSLNHEIMGTLADTLETIADNMVTGDKMDELIDRIEHSKYTRTDENERIVNSLRGINQEIIHSQDILATINDKILNHDALYEVLRAVGTENSEAVEEALIEQFQTLPTMEQVDFLIDKIEQANRLGDRAGLDEVLQDIKGEFATMSDRIDAYNEELTSSIEQSATAQAQSMRQQTQSLMNESQRTRTRLEGQIAGLGDQVEQMNEQMNENITGLRGELTGSVIGIRNELANLYDNIQRNSIGLQGLQQNQSNIQTILQGIEQSIKALLDIGLFNGDKIVEYENKFKELNDIVTNNGLQGDVTDEILSAITSFEDEFQNFVESYPLETSKKQKMMNDEEKIATLKHIYIPSSDVDDSNYKITKFRDLLKKMIKIGIPEITNVIGKTYRPDLYPEANTSTSKKTQGIKLGDINALPKEEILELKEKYKGVEHVILEILNNAPPPPIFSESTTTSEASSTTTSEGVKKIPGRTLLENFYRPRRTIPEETLPYDFRGEPTQMASAPSGEKSEGKGLMKHAGVSIRMTGRGIAPRDKYVPLGKYLVNIHKLEHNNIVSFKSTNHKSTNIQSKRVSQQVANILKNIVDGDLDNIQMDNLTEDDISYLFQLIKKCELQNFLDGKAENKIKTKTEEEIHRFHVLQGEIVAGNDNPQLIREFKAILLTMMNEGKLSKKEAGDVLIQMSLLGI